MNSSTISASSPWLPYGLPPQSTAPRLFCFPNAGAGAASFNEWRRAAPYDILVCPVEPPGRAGRIREMPYRHVGDLVRDTAEALGDCFSSTYGLFGHSVGALAVFELAHHLREKDLPSPAHIFVSGRPAPQLPDTRKPLRDLPVDNLIEELRRMGGIPESLLREREVLEMLVPAFRADFSVNEDYCYQDRPPLSVPVTVFGGDADPRAQVDELRAWRNLTTASFDVRIFAGGHFFLVDHLPEILAVISRALRPTL